MLFGFALVHAQPGGCVQCVTIVNASIKTHPTDGSGPDTVAVIKAARNEFEAFQIVVAGPATGVSMTPHLLVGPNGATIPTNELRLYREAYVNITTPSNDEGGTGAWPDALIPDVDEVVNEKRNAFPMNVPAGETRVVWAEVHIPVGQPAGTYHGTITVTGSGLGTVDVPVTLEVWDFTLPSTSSLRSTFGMGWNTACVAHYGSYAACGYDAGVEHLHLVYARFMLDHRITADVVYTGPTNCSGETCDCSHFDDVYGTFFDGHDPNLRLIGAQPTSIRYIWAADAAHYAAWAKHFRERGWLGVTFDYTCDEPPNGCAWSAINARAAMVHGADSEFATLVTTNIDEANAHGITASTNILSPVVNHLDDKPGSAYAGNQRPRYDAFLSNPGKSLWWYQSCMSHGCYIKGGSYFSGWPSLVIDASAVQNRAQGILSWLYDVTGVLYYVIDLHLPDAWNGSQSLYDFGGNGDGTLLYPGRISVIGGHTDIPVASIRLKMLRDGFEDYEYFKLLADLGDAAFARQVGRGLFPDVFSTRQPATSLQDAREAIAHRILELKGSPPPPQNGGLSVTSAFSLSSTPVINQPTTATFSVMNSGQDAITVDYFFAGCRDSANRHCDFPAVGPVTIQPGATYSYRGSVAFAAAGDYTAWPAYYDGANWIELGSHTSFSVQQPTPGQFGLTVSLSPASPAVNQGIMATYTVQNVGGQPLTAQYFFAGGRNGSGAHFDFPPVGPITLQPGQQYTYQGARSLPQAGAYTIWPAYYDGVNWVELGSHATVNVR